MRSSAAEPGPPTVYFPQLKDLRVDTVNDVSREQEGRAAQ
jgi:hypothetical protein